MMFKDYEVSNIRKSFTTTEVTKAMKDVDLHVDKEFLGTRKEALGETLFGESVVDRIEREGYYLIPMGRSGVAFDYGDTSSGGIRLPDCVPYGHSKEAFRDRLMAILNVMNIILK